jgi:thioesterase domain-containing protein
MSLRYCLYVMTVDKAERLRSYSLPVQRDPQGAPGTPRPAVFFLPGLFGEDDPEIAKFCEPIRASLDFLPVGYFDWAQHVETRCDFAILAEHVLKQIETRMPTGPIRMAGYSLGGHLAFATALSLEAKGRRVESLAILDAPLDFASLKGPLSKRLRARTEQILSFNVRGGLASVIGKVLIRERSRPILHSLLRYRNTALPFHFETDLHRKLTMQLVRRLHDGWWEKTLQEANPLQAPWNLFRSQEHEASEREDLGWAPYCRNLRVIHVAGTHRGMLDPAVSGPFRAAFIDALIAAHK